MPSSDIFLIIDPAITVLERIRHEPIKKLKPLRTAHRNKFLSMKTDLKMNCCLLNWLLLLVVDRQWRKRSRRLACAKTVAVRALPVYRKFYNNIMFN